MNLTLNTLNLAANAKPAPAAGLTPAASDAAGTPARAQDPAAPDAAVAQAPAQPALAFARWLGLEQIAPAPDADAPALDAALPVAELAAAAEEQQPAADSVLLGAMSMTMPLMPVAQATLAAVAAALPGVPAAKETAPAADTDVSLPSGDTCSAATSAALPSALTAVAAPVSAPTAAPVAMPAQNTADAGAAKAALANIAHSSGPVLSGEAPAVSEGAQDLGAAPLAERAPAGSFGVAAPAAGAGAAQRTADTVTLSGPPTAWRQTLQEALGERLQLQVGKNTEQAVIRLEPPMLGRVEIAIRHSAGSLEVHISATHGEVLRQLQSVSENLRNDLAQRQFTDVAVNVAPAPRATGTTPQFAGDANGRGRQQDGREQEQTPGNALAEAHTGASPFSLNGRA